MTLGTRHGHLGAACLHSWFPEARRV